MKACAILLVLVALCFSFMAPAFANEPKDKICRGTANLFSGFLEVPQNIDIEWKKCNPVTGTVTGLFKGLFWGIARTVSGVWDIITFPFPSPDKYDSAIQPEYVQRGIQTHFIGEQQSK
jgi:putative exosortase-associated protein (TIGR04073 family)